MKPPPLTSRWIYVGKNGTKNLSHTIIQNGSNLVATWSDPHPKEDQGGDSWLGTPAQFFKEFTPET